MTRRPDRRSLFELVGGPALMELYPGLTPALLRSLTVREYSALVRHYERRNKPK